MSETIKGSCHCGAVTVEVPNPTAVIVCHCGDCQKLHGNFFAMARGEEAAVKWTGEDNIQWYQSSEKVRRSFCKTCGSRLAKDPQGNPNILVSIGLFHPATGMQIIKSVHDEDKPDWYELPRVVG